jgi:hypothetical protein
VHNRGEHRGALLAAGDLTVIERWLVKPVLYPMPVTCGTELTAGPVVSARGRDPTMGRVVNRAGPVAGLAFSFCFSFIISYI